MKKSAQTFRIPIEAWAACSRRREEADPCKLPVDPPAHEPDSKSGSKLHALQTLPRRFNAPETREAFGVRPACRRFRYMVPMRGGKTVTAIHEPQGRARHSVRAAAGRIKPRRARSDAPYRCRRFMVPKPGALPWRFPRVGGYIFREAFRLGSSVYGIAHR